MISRMLIYMKSLPKTTTCSILGAGYELMLSALLRHHWQTALSIYTSVLGNEKRTIKKNAPKLKT
jgi:hypothetical protein